METTTTTVCFINSTAKDYEMEYDQVKRIYIKSIDSNDFYSKLESFIEIRRRM